VTQILGLRAFSSQLLCEQVVGRGLRRMSYDIDPSTGMLMPEYCDVFGIPFEVIPVQGAKPSAVPRPAPSTLVQALDERKQFALEFPRVEGYVRDVKSRIRCDVSAIPLLKIEPQIEPTRRRRANSNGLGRRQIEYEMRPRVRRNTAPRPLLTKSTACSGPRSRLAETSPRSSPAAEKSLVLIGKRPRLPPPRRAGYSADARNRRAVRRRAHHGCTWRSNRGNRASAIPRHHLSSAC